MNILQMLCKSTLIIDLTECSSSTNKEKNTSTKKGVKSEKFFNM
jgi:hypothetical protein